MDYCEQMKNEIKDAIERVFGKINDCGCYTHAHGEWLSTEHIYEIICETIDENSYMFLED